MDIDVDARAIDLDDFPLAIQVIRKLLAVPKTYFSPRFFGLDGYDPSKPALWVGNHTIYGLLDVPLMIEYLYENYGVVLRSLGDRGHFEVPLWRDLLRQGGMVLGTPENCSRLMAKGENVLVFPGGAREVCRRKGENHQLIWKQRTGFVRMAIEHGYDIVPFASLGPDYAVDIVLDAEELSGSAPWQILKRWLPLEQWTRQGDTIPPLIRGFGPTLVPRPERFYFGFAPRIRTADFADNAMDSELLWRVRRLVSHSIEQEMLKLESIRKIDKALNWHPIRRWMTS